MCPAAGEGGTREEGTKEKREEGAKEKGNECMYENTCTFCQMLSCVSIFVALFIHFT